MDMMQWVIILLIVGFFAIRFLPVKGVTNITVQQAKEKFSHKDVQFIDVRTPGEYKANHRPPFKNIPLSSLTNKLDQLEKDKDIVVICQSGMRSANAAKLLRKHGFEKIYNVKGGMGAWF